MLNLHIAVDVNQLKSQPTLFITALLHTKMYRHFADNVLVAYLGKAPNEFTTLHKSLFRCRSCMVSDNENHLTRRNTRQLIFNLEHQSLLSLSFIRVCSLY